MKNIDKEKITKEYWKIQDKFYKKLELDIENVCKKYTYRLCSENLIEIEELCLIYYSLFDLYIDLIWVDTKSNTYKLDQYKGNLTWKIIQKRTKDMEKLLLKDNMIFYILDNLYDSDIEQEFILYKIRNMSKKGISEIINNNLE